VNAALRIAGRIPFHEAHDLVGRPAGVSDHPVEKDVLAADVVGPGPGTLLEQLEDLARERLGHPLVGVDDEEPGRRDLIHRPVLLRGRSEVLPLDDFHFGEGSGDRHRPVSREGIDQHDLVGESEALETLAEVDLFVEGGDDGGQAGTSHEEEVEGLKC